MAATAYSVALLGGARLPAAPRSALLPRRSVCQLRLQGNNEEGASQQQIAAHLRRRRFRGLFTRAFGDVADAPRLSLLRAKAASEDTSASGDELIEDLKAKVRANCRPNRHMYLFAIDQAMRACLRNLTPFRAFDF